MNISRVLFKTEQTKRLYTLICMIPILIIFITAHSGCSSQSSFRVDASQADLTALEGNWSGSFKSNDSQWSGTIEFSLTAGKDTAYGKVIMTPRGSKEPYLPAMRENRIVIGPRLNRFLTIHFVRVEEGAISGTLKPYFDPESGQDVTVIFYGRIIDDTLEGTYKSSAENVLGKRTGTWKVICEE